jgi:hypothetical protein
MQDTDAKERQLRQHIVQQELKAKETIEELQRTREELRKLTQVRTNKENVCLGN